MFPGITYLPVYIQKHRHVYIWKYKVSETGFGLRLQVKPIQLGPIDIVPISGR
jgi:hypothetical protein